MLETFHHPRVSVSSRSRNKSIRVLHSSFGSELPSEDRSYERTNERVVRLSAWEAIKNGFRRMVFFVSLRLDAFAGVETERIPSAFTVKISVEWQWCLPAEKLDVHGDQPRSSCLKSHARDIFLLPLRYYGCQIFASSVCEFARSWTAKTKVFYGKKARCEWGKSGWWKENINQSVKQQSR